MENVAFGNVVARGKGKGIGLWVLRVILGLAFLAAGGSKLAGAPAMVATFTQIGVGQWFRYLTGVLEVLGAIGLFFPKFTQYAATLLAVVMVGAVIAHLAILHTNPAPPLVLLILSGLVIWLSRKTA